MPYFQQNKFRHAKRAIRKEKKKIERQAINLVRAGLLRPEKKAPRDREDGEMRETRETDAVDVRLYPTGTWVGSVLAAQCHPSFRRCFLKCLTHCPISLLFQQRRSGKTRSPCAHGRAWPALSTWPRFPHPSPGCLKWPSLEGPMWASPRCSTRCSTSVARARPPSPTARASRSPLTSTCSGPGTGEPPHLWFANARVSLC